MKTLKVVISICAATLLAAPAFADKPEWAGKGKGKHSEGKHDGGKHRTEARFDSRDRDVIRVYFDEQYSSGHCPPGLRKKNNGCMPPGQAKKWEKGRPLPRDVVFYEVPPRLVVQLGTPPSGHKYVRVASDILLIAVGSAMVIDAIQDLGRI